MKNAIVSLSMFLVLINLFGCRESTESIEKQSFAIYLVQDKLKKEEIPDIKIENVKLAEFPIISDKDIITYNWKSQRIAITEQAAKKIPDHSSVLEGIYFVTVVNNERCYLGAFWSIFSSLWPNFPTITVMPQEEDKKILRILNINSAFDERMEKEDTRKDIRIKECFKNLEKLIED